MFIVPVHDNQTTLSHSFLFYFFHKINFTRREREAFMWQEQMIPTLSMSFPPQINKTPHFFFVALIAHVFFGDNRKAMKKLNSLFITKVVTMYLPPYLCFGGSHYWPHTFNNPTQNDIILSRLEGEVSL